MKRLNKEDEEYNKYLNEVADEENRKFMEKNLERLDGLEGRKDDLALLEEQMAEAEALFNEYNTAAAADRPDDYTEEYLADLDAAWFDL